MKKRVCIMMLVCCLILTLFPATPTGATERPAIMPGVSEEETPGSDDNGEPTPGSDTGGEPVPGSDTGAEPAPGSSEIVLEDSLLELLDTYFKELLTEGVANYDDETLNDWLSPDALEKVIMRVENLGEREQVVDDVAFTVTRYDAHTRELSADVTETVNGTPCKSTHTLQLSGNADDGWRVESDIFIDSVLFDPNVNVGAAAPKPNQTHPNTWKNTGNQARDIVEIALKQEDYREVRENYTKYNVWFYGYNESAMWCAIFISWCANQAGIPTSIIKKNAAASRYSVSNMRNNLYGTPAYAFGDKAAKPGDIAYIGKSNVSNHVGLVYKADSDYIYTIEGNCGNKVTKRKYSAKTGQVAGSKNPKIIFFARPNYKGGETTVPPEDPKLEIKPAQTAYKITWGSECDVTGNITSNYPLTEVKATLGNWSASVPNLKGATSLDIGTSAINSFKGADLPVGTHTLKITAKNSGGKTDSKSITITVVPAAKISFSPNPLRIEQGTSDAVTIQFQGEDISDLDISAIRASDIVSFKEWREKDFGTGHAALILEGNRVGTQTFQISLLRGGERLISGVLDVEVYALDDGIKERFDFDAEVTFQNSANLYRTPTDAAPYDKFSQPSCLCNRGVKLRDGSVWLAMTAECGGGWFRIRDAFQVVPVISVSPATLTLKPGETKTLSVRYGSMPDARAFNVDSYPNTNIVTVSEESRDDMPPLDSYGAMNVKLSIHANQEGTADLAFRLLDTQGNTRAEKTFPVKVTSETVVPPDVPPEKYYYEPIKWAVEHNIIMEPSRYFRPAERCTRASAVMFLWRLAGAPAPTSGHNPFSDIVPVDDYYTAVLWAVERGITNGTSETKFSPDAYCNRGQIVTLLHRYAGTPPAKGVNTFKDVAKGRFCYDSVNWASGLGITQGFSDNTFHPAEVCTRAQIITFIYRYAAQN